VGVPFSVYPYFHIHSDIWIFDTSSGTYQETTPLPLTNNLPSATLEGSTLHLVGGETGGVGDNGRVHLGGRYFGHRPDLYLRGAIVPASEGDSGLYHAAMYQPLPGASLATSEVRVSGVCRADLGPVTVALGSVTQETPCVTAIGEGFVAYKASFFDTTIQHAGGPGNIGLGVRQQGGPGGSPYEHEISIYFSP
jgi:hypothetical protein